MATNRNFCLLKLYEMLTKIKINKITAFDNIEVELSKGVNVFIGANGTGKTHLMKLLYASMLMADSSYALQKTMEQTLYGLFLPDSLGRLVRRSVGRGKGEFYVYRQDDDNDIVRTIRCELTSLNHSKIFNAKTWAKKQSYNVVYIPVKDMLANSVGFNSLYEKRELYFESIYPDIVRLALLPAVKGRATKEKTKLLDTIQNIIDGRVVKKNEKFYLVNAQGNLEFTLLAEGYRKLGLLYSLIQNESISPGSILFWDEPETNLNPKLTQQLIQIILELQRMGTQVFISTHDYVFLKELEMSKQTEDAVLYHSLYKQNDTIECQTVENLNEITYNAINDVFDSFVARTFELEWED